MDFKDTPLRPPGRTQAATMPKVFLAKYKKEVAASREEGENCGTRLEDTGRK